MSADTRIEESTRAWVALRMLGLRHEPPDTVLDNEHTIMAIAALVEHGATIADRLEPAPQLELIPSERAAVAGAWHGLTLAQQLQDMMLETTHDSMLFGLAYAHGPSAGWAWANADMDAAIWSIYERFERRPSEQEAATAISAVGIGIARELLANDPETRRRCAQVMCMVLDEDAEPGNYPILATLRMLAAV